MDRRAGWKLYGPGTAAPGSRMTASASVPGIQSASTTPVEHVAACPASHGDARQRTHAERVGDVLRAEQHGHVARSANRQDPRIFQLEIARIGAAQTTEECSVRLALPARAVDEALTIGRESGGRYGTPAERRGVIFGEGGPGPD